LRPPVFQALLAIVLLPAACAAQTEPAPTSAGNEFLTRFWLSGQVNIISQGHPTFRSPYSGPNSFSAASEIATSRVVTLYTGFVISATTDFLFDLESTSGHNLSGSHGLGAYTNVDAAGVPNDRPYVARAILHHEIPLSSKSVETERGPLQMAGQEAARRLDIYVGKMSLADFFDVNAIGSDSHFQFMNWTLDNNGAYGFPADPRGYTYAFVAEYHDHNWALRFAEALSPKVDSPAHIDANLVRSRSESIEYELHHTLIRNRGGVVRALSFVDHGSFGNYREAIEAYRASGETSPPDITAQRQPGRMKYGFGLNVEQELTPLLRAFGRFGWAEGHLETLAFTEADQSISGGVDLKGNPWRRKDDKLGVAMVSNALSGDHREYLALGGTGLVLGDGGLNYRREKVLETYYTLKLWRSIYLSADVQRVWNPGYNHDRGPALVGAVRLHFEGVLFTPH
jgi:high affinity Mn2+ porin